VALIALLEAPFTGRAGGADVNETPFYATALSASGGRAVVRDWLETTAGSAKRDLLRYFRLQRLVDWNGEPGAPLSVSRLTNATLRIPKGANDEASPNVPRTLLRAALSGGRLPESLLYEAVKRNRAEQRVLRDRAVLIKMTLASRRGDEEGRQWMVELDESTDDPAYLCGRLLAVLDAIQYAALGSVNATAVDRFYGTASSAPITVFPRLINGATPHLGKLRRERQGTYLALDGQMQAVMERLRRNFPTVLTLEDQGLFALGFYHQKAADSRARQQRRGGQAANDVPDSGGPDGDTADDAADNDE
jgi:CRISPR-associated protein Csd1